MSPIVKPPTSNYQHPLDGPLHACPHCGKILNQHSAPGQPTAAQPPAPATAPGVIDLFAASNPVVTGELEGTFTTTPDPTTLTQEAPVIPPQLIDSGDVVPAETEPQLIRRTEHVQAGHARPEKGATHVIHGMVPRVKVEPLPLKHGQEDALQALDTAVIGGKVTIVVCCYGKDHENLHRRCLNSIVKTVPPSRMDLRIIANQVGLASSNYFNSLPVTKVYPDMGRRRKYPAMRQVFMDKEDPIQTNYIVWFDDDSYVRNEAWLSILAQTIVAQKAQERVGMYGSLMYHPLKHPDPKKDPRTWFRNGAWFRKKGFRDQRGRESPNGNKIHFCVGGFWAISTECMRACNIPDSRLNHNGGDVALGEQIWQNDYKMKQFNEKKQYIHTSASPRRGFHERFPWYR